MGYRSQKTRLQKRHGYDYQVEEEKRAGRREDLEELLSLNESMTSQLGMPVYLVDREWLDNIVGGKHKGESCNNYQLLRLGHGLSPFLGDQPGESDSMSHQLDCNSDAYRIVSKDLFTYLSTYYSIYQPIKRYVHVNCVVETLY